MPSLTTPFRSLPRRLRRVALSGALLLTAAHAQVSPDVLRDARAALAQGQPQAAYALLAPYEAQHAGEPAFDYLIGIAALDSGRLSQAIFALERVLAVEPADNLARAEIARAYLLAGETASARDQLQQARLGRMPPAAAAAIDRVLAALAPAEAAAAAGPSGRTASAYVEAAVGFDSNANSATSAGQFAIPALPGAVFVLDAGSRRRSDRYAAAAAGGTLQLRLDGGWSLAASANGRSTHYYEARDVRNRQLDGSVAATYTAGAHQFSAGVQGLSYWLAGERYRDAQGVTGQWQMALGSQAQVSAFAQAGRIGYEASPGRDADRRLVGVGTARALGDTGSVAFASVYAVRETARDAANPQQGHRGAGARAGAEWRRGTTTAFATASHERRRYGGEDPDFATTRRDRQSELTLGLHWDAAPGWRITPQIAHTRAQSSIVLYDWRRTTAQLAVRHTF